MNILKACPYCGGHGYINQFEDIEGGCRAWAKECIACNGTGTILCQETNADRIRAMSDEELAHWLEYEGGGACAEALGWLEWLRQPAKEA